MGDPAAPGDLRPLPDGVISVDRSFNPGAARVTQTISGRHRRLRHCHQQGGHAGADRQQWGRPRFDLHRRQRHADGGGQLQLPPRSRPLRFGFFPDGRSAYVTGGGGSASPSMAAPSRWRSHRQCRRHHGAADGRWKTGHRQFRHPSRCPGGLACASACRRRVAAAARGWSAGWWSWSRPRSGYTAGRNPDRCQHRQCHHHRAAGRWAESIVLSPDGTMLAAVITNGSHNPRTSPAFNDFGLLKHRHADRPLTPVAEAQTGPR